MVSVVTQKYSSHDELVHHDADGIVVRDIRVVLTKHNFRRHVARGATRVGVVSYPLHSRYSEVRDIGVPLVVEHDVLRLDVSVDDILRVNVLQSKHDVRNDEP